MIKEYKVFMSAELSPRAAEIVSYTRLLLEKGGYNSFSYADIAAQVNIRKASIHHHFPSKADLVRAVVVQYRTEAREGLAMIESKLETPLEMLRAYVGYWAECIRSGSSSFCICALLAAEIPTMPEVIAKEVRGHFEDLSTWLTSVLESGASQGLVHLRASPIVEARTFMASVHGAMLAARSFGDSEAFKVITQLLIERLGSKA
ncbi:TetR/AcrR family transcriptional regulator [Ectopseudomonas khazarica]|uniref:TetR/AcrR family transcriptional regulator n=1 Tax=Ectopseudomonas khazarica TaxID=2502979 RepID=UPI00384E9530